MHNPNYDQHYMKQALVEAEKAFEKSEIPIGTVIVLEHVIIARAHNLTETLKDITAHAEMLAITEATTFLGEKYLTDCTIYITIEPCPMCAGALAWSRIKRIVYGAKEEKCGYSKISPSILPNKTKILGGVMGEKSASLMKKFFKERRQKQPNTN